LKIIRKTTESKISNEKFNTFFGKLAGKVEYNFSWLKVRKEVQESDYEIMIVYQKKDEKRFLLKINSSDDLTDSNIDLVLRQLHGITHKIGCS
jgi:hypothetical protein